MTMTKQEELTALREAITISEEKIKILEQELVEDNVKTTIEEMPNGYMLGIKRKDRDERDMIFYTDEEFKDLFMLMTNGYMGFDTLCDDRIIFLG